MVLRYILPCKTGNTEVALIFLKPGAHLSEEASQHAPENRNRTRVVRKVPPPPPTSFSAESDSRMEGMMGKIT
jgi:hypothetical protein